MSRNIFHPTTDRNVAQNRTSIKHSNQKPLAFRWWTPDCSTTYTDPDDQAEFCFTGIPTLVNGWAQPASVDNIQFFAFRLHVDGSLEFRGHLDSSGASSGTIAFTLPGANAGEVDFLEDLDGDQFFLTVIYDGVTPETAMIYIEAATGDVTITFPV